MTKGLISSLARYNGIAIASYNGTPNYFWRPSSILGVALFIRLGEKRLL
jgi:hypothetical protein